VDLTNQRREVIGPSLDGSKEVQVDLDVKQGREVIGPRFDGSTERPVDLDGKPKGPPVA